MTLQKEFKKMKELIQEVINLIIKFFKTYDLKDEMLTIPKNVKRLGFKSGLLGFGMTLIALIFSFMLKATNMMIERRLILLGIILFMLYNGQQVVNETFRVFSSSESTKYRQIFDNELILRGSQIIGKTSNKVWKRDAVSNMNQVMSNESVLNTIENYLGNLWEQKVKHPSEVLEIISIISMIIVAILTNTSIPQVVFIPLILVFVLISFISSAYVNLNRNMLFERTKEYDNKHDLIINDLLRVPVIVKNDLDMRVNNLQNTINNSNESNMKFYKKLHWSSLFVTTIEVFSQYGIIIFYLLGVEWSSIDLATITQIAAVLAIVKTALEQVSSFIRVLDSNSKRIAILDKEKEDMYSILEVYHKESSKDSEPKVDNINIEPFSIQYIEESENDKPFTLMSEKPIHINKGEIAILYGASGSGKSTFMKMLTERICTAESSSTEIPSTSRFLFYDEVLEFGSLTIYDELFCCSENPNLEKMQGILENLHLWDEIKRNCVDVWKWMKEKKFKQSLSNGQKQRLIIAKILYWLDDEIDVLALDECTSGLDDKQKSDFANAEKVLEYIVKYANPDKNRIIIISTHQHIDGFIEKLSGEYTFKILQFNNKGGYNLVEERFNTF